MPKLVFLGVWEEEKFIGAVIFGSGASPNLLKLYGLGQLEGCELVRVALANHRTPVSRILAICLRMMREEFPGLRLVVSFADPLHGHIGGIYKAGGWIYSGETPPSKSYVDKNGRRWHPRIMSVSGVKEIYGSLRATPKYSDCAAVSEPGKHRYLMPLDDAMRRQVALIAQPYPEAVPSKTQAHEA